MFKELDKRNRVRIDLSFRIRFRVIPLVAKRMVHIDWNTVVVKNFDAESLCFYHDKNLEIGTLLDLKIDLPGIPHCTNAVAEIVNIEKSKPSSLFCVTTKFKKIDKRKKEIINTFVEEMATTKKQISIINFKNPYSCMSELMFHYTGNFSSQK